MLRIHRRLSMVLKISNKSSCSNNVYSEKEFNVLYIEIKNTLKKFSSDKINSTKNALLFLSRAPSYHSFNLRFLYELYPKVLLSKTVRGIFHFRFRFVFIKVSIFVQQNYGPFDFKTS